MSARKQPKIELAPGFELSITYANTRDNYKVVDVGNVLAYVVWGGSGKAVARVTPIYRADVWTISDGKRGICSSYEHGEPLNGFTYPEDFEGCTLANIAATAIGALESRARARAVAGKRQPAKRAAKKASR